MGAQLSSSSSLRSRVKSRVKSLADTVRTSTEQMRASSDPEKKRHHHSSMQDAIKELKLLCKDGKLGPEEKAIILSTLNQTLR
jgi:hypothetical protein